MKDIFIIVPTLNPNKEILEDFLKKLTKEFDNVLLYDDGCRSEYKEFFDNWEKKGVVVLHHYKNLGKGRAMKDAFNYLLVKYPSLKGVVTADSDGQHSIKDIKTCAKMVLDNPSNLIMGCRNFDGENVPKRNRFGNKTTCGVLKAFVGISVSDTQTGLRGLPKEVMVKYMDTKGERFEYETNQLIDTIDKNIEIKEFQIETIYLENSNAESHFNVIKDSIAIYKTFFKYIIASVSSFAIDILLFTLFNSLLNSFSESIILATVFARIISSIYNYFINLKLVFKKGNKSSLVKYIILVVVQMCISAGCTYLLSDVLSSWNTTLIKVLVDAVIFIANFVIQREIVFKNEK